MLKTIATLTIVHMAVSSCFVSGHNRSNDVINASISDSNKAMFDGIGLAWCLRKPKPPQARPKPGLSGQAGPEQH